MGFREHKIHTVYTLTVVMTVVQSIQSSAVYSYCTQYTKVLVLYEYSCAVYAALDY